VANYEECLRKPADVGSYPGGESWCGALDLAGNVYEWVADWWGTYSADKQKNPHGPESGERKIMRGGSWIDLRENLLSAQRIRAIPTDYSDALGIRCVVAP
jgi:formylglycine-generating enzyme required for sulfatase activity